MLSALRIVRPWNLVFLAFALLGLILLGYQIDGARFYARVPHFWIGLLFVYVICSVTASGYVINDYFDVKTDAINKPEKQIVGKILTAKDTRLLYIALLLDAIFFSSLLFWFTGKFWFTPIVFLTQILLFVYAKYLKKSFLLGNLLVAILTIVPYWLVVYVFEFGFVVKIIVAILTLSGFMLNFIREVVKDWEDCPGDKVIGANTLALQLGENRIRKVVVRLLHVSRIIHLLIIAIYVFINPDARYVLGLFWPLILIVLLETQMIRKTKQNLWPPRKISKTLKLCMLFGVVWLYCLMIFFVFFLELRAH